eukprot:scaffold23775_cov20-Tisochrysis_lutea.AAC.2
MLLQSQSRFAQTAAQRGCSKMMPPSISASSLRSAVPAYGSRPSVSAKSNLADNQALLDKKAIGKAEFVPMEKGKAIMDDIDCVIFDCDGGCAKCGQEGVRRAEL